MANITITFPDGSQKEAPKGVTSQELAADISPQLAKKILVARVNGKLWDVMRPIETDARVQFFTWDDDEGKHAFWHTSAHLTAEALQELYPGVKFAIGPAVDDGYYYDVDMTDTGTTLTESDLPKLEKRIMELAKEDQPLVRQEISKEDALHHWTEEDKDPYKVELIQDLEDGTISTYTCGNFVDLCRGPHIPSTGLIKAVKLTKLAGAYWRGDENRQMLTRVYGITFPKAKMLDEYLQMVEEAKLRDHRKIGKELELFTFSSEVGPGLPLWLPRGTQLRLTLQRFLERVQETYGYQQVMTPHIGSKQLYVTSGHWAKYGKDSFRPITTPQEGEEYMLKPMNCPHHCIVFRSKPRSYRDLPVRIAEFGTVYRYEQSGELHGLTRVRGFTQDDAHIFCRPDQIKEEFERVMDIIYIVFKTLEFKSFEAQISLRDPNNKEKYIGSDENWEKAENAIIEVCKDRGVKAKVVEGEAAFYGPKLDFMVKDAIGRKWQLGTIQVDYNLPERFQLEYTGEDGQMHRPVMLHRAPFGSIERFVAVLCENTAGKFPLWLCPDQVAVLPVSEKYLDYAYKVEDELKEKGIRVKVDDRDEKLGKKIRETELMRIPYLLIVGEKEEAEGTVSIRKQGEGEQGTEKISTFADAVAQEIYKQTHQWEQTDEAQKAFAHQHDKE